MRLIDADALLAEYDAQHEGPPGRARALIENAPTIGGWISVKDRLPDEDDHYLCWFGSFPLGAFARVCTWSRNKDAFWCYADNSKWHNITHWMPLPEPPKGVNTDAAD